MSAESSRIHVQNSAIRVRESQDDEVLERFRDLRRDLRGRSAYEVTNRDVLSILLDCYYVHRENEPVPFERLRASRRGQR